MIIYNDEVSREDIEMSKENIFFGVFKAKDKYTLINKGFSSINQFNKKQVNLTYPFTITKPNPELSEYYGVEFENIIKTDRNKVRIEYNLNEII